MTHPGMRFRLASSALLALALSLPGALFTGCSTVHGFAQGRSGQSPTAGASVSLPLGK